MRDTGLSVHARLLLVVGVLVALTVAGFVALWPRPAELPDAGDPLPELVAGEIRSIETVDDAGAVDEGGGDAAPPDEATDPSVVGDGPSAAPSGELLRLEVALLDGPDAGTVEELEVAPEGYPDFAVGDRVELSPTGEGTEASYFITDFQRLPVLGLLLGVFVAAVLAIGRWHGLRSLLGLGVSLLLVVRFIVPAILAGQHPPTVALVGALGVMLVTLYLTHGINEMTTAAVIGTAAALLLTVGMGLAFISSGKITGFASDDAVFARFAIEGLDLQGLVLAGLIIAALGVLDDVTVSQASTVFALHDTDPTLSFGALFGRAMRVGRDHIASVVNTLFLAYAGASLALLVLFSTGGLPVLELLNSEVLAEELIKTAVGSLGLIAAVPSTTVLAVVLARGRPDPADRVRGRAALAGVDLLDERADEELDDDERAYRAWVAYLRRQRRDDPATHEGDGAPADDEDGPSGRAR